MVGENARAKIKGETMTGEMKRRSVLCKRYEIP
jgi:hypothetical protein